MSTAFEAFARLRGYCEAQEFKGWDPYDGLNSAVFQATPLKDWDLARLLLIQTLKRSPINLRPLLMVAKDHNPKGIGLLLNGYCNILRISRAGDDRFGPADDIEETIRGLSDLLISLITPGYSGACWGYNFGWQARRLFYFPAYTPTVVATAFCVSALINAAEVLGEKKLLEVAISSADFIVNDLHRTDCNDGFLFSYSPLQGNDTVYNASLLGAKVLSLCYQHTKNQVYKDIARSAVQAACQAQEPDGSWVYGRLVVQSWKDSFHTGYNLEAIATYQACCDDHSFESVLNLGYQYYLQQFFLQDGTPKYYNDRIWPIDIHCPGQLWVTVSTMDRWAEAARTCEAVLDWTVFNMQADEGFFYYQLKKFLSSRISYMRWSNAFMFNSLSYYLKEDRVAR